MEYLEENVSERFSGRSNDFPFDGRPIRRLGESGGGWSSGCSFSYQGGIVLEQRLIDFAQALEDGSIGRDLFTQPNEGPHHEDTHLDGTSLWRILAAITASV